MLESFSKAVKLRDDIHLYIIGDGENRMMLEYLRDSLGLTDYVTFLGQKTNPFVYMDKMDAFHKAGETAKAKLCAQLLKYAEEAQKTFNYNTGDMATEGMPAEYTSYIMDTMPELNQTHTIPATQNNIKVYSHELMLESVIEHSILYYMPKNYVASDYYAVFVHKDVNNNKETENKEYRVEFTDCETYGTRYIYLKFSSLLANDMRDEVTITIYHKDGTELMSPYTFTVASLAASKLAANPTLVPAMMNYADCAKEVFG